MGLLDWLNAPVDMSDASAGMNNLGLIGATLRDVGSSLNGGAPSALDSYYARAQKANDRADVSPGGDFRASGLNNFGLLGAALRDAGASLNGNDPSALESFYTRAQRLSAERRNAAGRATDASYRPGFPTYG